MMDKLDRQIMRHKEKAADHHQGDGGIKTLPRQP
jgi:ribosome-associated translation inhibitor RaiA